ncbi:MAG: amidohydrolase [Campylobacteraceae bacterium]|nr:amidohydrolase [Campylobacteraceae bacterium]
MKELEKQIISWRRELHKNPEISFCEYETTNFIENILKKFGVFEIEKLAKTGLVATLKANKKTDKTIAFRADIDALELTETNSCEFASKNKGVMHACGHDAHTAIMLGFASLLSKEQEKLDKNIKLIFQRGEEIAPGGAGELVENGVMKDVEKIFSLHVMPGRKAGSISIKSGVASANKNTFDIHVKGKGGHSSAPQNCIDPILIASSIVVNLQTIIARNIDPFSSGVISIASFKSGSEYGVIPENAHLTGAIRSFDENVRENLKQKLTLVAKNSALALGGEAEVTYTDWDYSAIYNDEKICERLYEVVEQNFPEGTLIKDKLPQSFSEDFSEYLRKSKGVMVWLGVGENAPKLHNPNFNPDENAFIIGARYFYEVAKEYAYEK